MSSAIPDQRATAVGVVGARSIGRAHIAAIAQVPGLTLVARSGGADVPEVAHVPLVSPHALIADPQVDVVAICTPSDTHATLARESIAAGKHLLVEKPLATDAQTAHELLQAATERGVRVFTAVQRRYEPEYVHLKQLLATGACGDVRLVEVRLHWQRDDAYFRTSPWRAASPGGDVTQNQALHSIDLLLWLLGPVESAAAHHATLGRTMQARDTLTATLALASGALGTLSLSTATPPGRPAELVVHTEAGRIALGQGEVIDWDVSAPPPASRSRATAGAADPAAIGSAGQVELWRDISESLRTGRSSRCDGESSIATLALLAALEEAARTGARVKVRVP